MSRKHLHIVSNDLKLKNITKIEPISVDIQTSVCTKENMMILSEYNIVSLQISNGNLKCPEILHLFKSCTNLILYNIYDFWTIADKLYEEISKMHITHLKLRVINIDSHLKQLIQFINNNKTLKELDFGVWYDYHIPKILKNFNNTKINIKYIGEHVLSVDDINFTRNLLTKYHNIYGIDVPNAELTDIVKHNLKIMSAASAINADAAKLIIELYHRGPTMKITSYKHILNTIASYIKQSEDDITWQLLAIQKIETQ